MSSDEVRITPRASAPRHSYYPNAMRKREIRQAETPDWFLVEWMRVLRVSQAALGRETGWSKATVNDIYHGKTSYYRQILNEAAHALKVHPFELLMPPEAAMAIRKVRQEALNIIEAGKAIDRVDLRNGTDG